MNPYYVPPAIPDMSDQVMKFGELMQNRRLKEAELADERAYREGMLSNAKQNRRLKEAELADERAYREGMLSNANRTADIHQQQVNLEARKLPASQQNFSVTDFLPLKSVYAQKGYDKALSSIFDRLDQWGKDNNVTKGVAANVLSTQWETFFKPQAVEGLTKEYMNRAKDPNFLGSPQEKELKEMINTFAGLDGETAKSIFFKSVAEEEANSKAAIELLKLEKGYNNEKVIPAGGVLTKDGKVIVRNPRAPSDKLVQVEDEDGNVIFVPANKAVGKKAGKVQTKKKSLKDILNPNSTTDNDPLGLRKK